MVEGLVGCSNTLSSALKLLEFKSCMGFLNCSWKNMWSLLGWVIYPVCSHLSFLISLIHWCYLSLGFFTQFRIVLQKLLGSFLPHLKKMLHWLSVCKLLFLGAFLCSVLTSFVWFEHSMDWMETGFLCVSSSQWAPAQSCLRLFLSICV